jgi:hypothetical protein
MANPPSKIQHGYLVLADISGYTLFLAGTELDHAHEILTDLLATIMGRFKTLLTISKLEGDAVFAQGSEATIMRGETLLELIETTYVAFRERAEAMHRHTTCTCRACKNIPTLDLKFIVHHGDYIIQNVDGVKELAGSDVNLVHRLLKNHVSEATGWRAYSLFTEKSLDHMGVKPEGLVTGEESYEHLGSVNTFSMDMHARFEALRQERHIVVDPAHAFLSWQLEYDAPPPQVWSWLYEPSRRHEYALSHGIFFKGIHRPGGRTGVGATTHCVHGKDVAMVETVLDWKPFDYFTVEQKGGLFGTIRVTVKLTALENNHTQADISIDGVYPGLPRFLHRPIISLIFTRALDYRKQFENMGVVMNKAMNSEHDDISTTPLLQPA